MDIIYSIPNVILALIIVFLSLFYSLVGFYFVERFIPAKYRKKDNDASSPIVGFIGIIVAILLAFVVIIVWQQYTVADADTSREAGILGDLWRQSYGYPEPLKSTVRNGIETYINTVINEEWPLMNDGKFSINAWRQIEEVERQIMAYQPTTIAEQQIQERQLTTINSAINSRRNRLYNINTGLNPSLWIVIILSAALGMASIWFLGASCRLIHIIGIVISAISLGLLLYILVAINDPFRGAISISPQYFETVMSNINRLKQDEANLPNPYFAP